MAELHDWQGVGTCMGDGYEWLYFDAEHPSSGAAIFISIMGPNPFDFAPFGMRADGQPGVRCPQCARTPSPQNHYGVAVGGILPPGSPMPGFEAEGYLHLDDPGAEVTFAPSPWKLTMPGVTVERSGQACALPKYVVTIDVLDRDRGIRVAGTLELVATHREWNVANALLFQDTTATDHRHHWAVHVPQGHVSGEITVSAGGADVSVPIDQWVGYHDHNWGTRRLGEGFARWVWGRALLADGRTVIAASIIPSLKSGEVSQRVPHASVVLRPDGPESEILTQIEPPAAGSAIPTRAVPGGIEVPSVLSFGALPAGSGHHVRFDTVFVVPGEFPGRYQRRLAMVTLTGANGAHTAGRGVTETLVAANFP